MKQIWMSGVLWLGVVATTAAVLAQGPPNAADHSSATPREQAEARDGAMQVHTFFLKDRSDRETRDLLTDMRSVMPGSVAYLINVGGQYAITVKANATDVALAQKMIAELDKAQKQYRVTYRLTEGDAGKRVGDQAYSLVVSGGERTELKEGSRVPVSTGTTGTPTAASGGTQIQYLDIGVDIVVTADAYGDGVKLQTKLEQSSLAESKSGTALDDPIIRQTELGGTAVLMLGKPVVLGSLDVPGSTRHQEVEVEVQAMP